MLKRVVNPEKGVINFGYDPLGRRIYKEAKQKRTCWLWDGNVPLHEWTETEREPLIDIVTWVFEDGTFVPTARITDRGSESIVTDYLGTPNAMFNGEGNKTWEADLDIYGRVRTFAGCSLDECPFRYQGQYEDAETGLYYNRFRYYDPESGSYLSQDPIGLAGNNPTLYGYVKDVNSWVDQLGLELVSVNPNDINYSQRTVSEVRVFDANKYKPIRVMDIDGQLVSYDNRRLLSAQNAGFESIEVELVKGDDIMPGSKKTWNEAFQKRFNDPRNIEAGGVVPNKGLKEKPLSCH
jgi:RHS repeat-associated protein